MSNSAFNGRGTAGNGLKQNVEFLVFYCISAGNGRGKAGNGFSKLMECLRLYKHFCGERAGNGQQRIFKIDGIR